jgi:hypothetical protein
MQTTVSFHMGNESDVKWLHNGREPEVVSHEAHIDPEGVWECLAGLCTHDTPAIVERIKHDPETRAYVERIKAETGSRARTRKQLAYEMYLADVCEELFGDAVREYDSQQKKPSRRYGGTLGYMHAVRNDKRGARSKYSDGTNGIVHEVIVAVGNTKPVRGDDGHFVRDGDGNYVTPQRVPPTVAVEVLKQYVSEWAARNPNMRIVGAYLHCDEQGVEHLHIVFIPWCHRNKTGLAVKVSIGGACREMGYEGTRYGENPVTVWQEAERGRIMEMLKERGYEIVRPDKGKGTQSVTAHVYKARAEAEKQIDEAAVEAERAQAEARQARAMADKHKAAEAQFKDEARKAYKKRKVEMQAADEATDAAERARKDAAQAKGEAQRARADAAEAKAMAKIEREDALARMDDMRAQVDDVRARTEGEMVALGRELVAKRDELEAVNVEIERKRKEVGDVNRCTEEERKMLDLMRTMQTSKAGGATIYELVRANLRRLEDEDDTEAERKRKGREKASQRLRTAEEVSAAARMREKYANKDAPSL